MIRGWLFYVVAGLLMGSAVAAISIIDPSTVETLVFRRGEWATGVRTTGVPRMRQIGDTGIIGGPEEIVCKNKGKDDHGNVVWQCSGVTHPSVFVKKYIISWEHQPEVNSPTVLAGSASIQYQLDYRVTGPPEPKPSVFDAVYEGRYEIFLAFLFSAALAVFFRYKDTLFARKPVDTPQLPPKDGFDSLDFKKPELVEAPKEEKDEFAIIPKVADNVAYEKLPSSKQGEPEKDEAKSIFVAAALLFIVFLVWIGLMTDAAGIKNAEWISGESFDKYSTSTAKPTARNTSTSIAHNKRR